MKPAIVSQARMTSTRLPGKVLKTIAGKPLLTHHLERLQASELDVYVATTLNESDDPIVELAHAMGLRVTRGSETDVLSRYALCAREFGLDGIVRVTSDCPLIDGDVIREAVDVWVSAQDECLYMSNTLERTYPRGFDFEIFSASALLDADRHATAVAQREHVTPFLHQNVSGRMRLRNRALAIDRSEYRITVDTPEDFEVIRCLIEDHAAHHLSCMKIIEVLDHHPEIAELNAHVTQKPLGQ